MVLLWQRILSILESSQIYGVNQAKNQAKWNITGIMDKEISQKAKPSKPTEALRYISCLNRSW